MIISIQVQIPTVALGPVLAVISSDVGLTSAQAGALTSIPVLCFALLTPIAPAVIGRLGLDRSVVLASLLLGLGLLVRSQGSIPALYGGSVLFGAAVATINIACPTFITRHFRHRALLLAGINTASVNVGSATAALLSAPLVAAFGWQIGLGVWSVVSFAAATVWFLTSRPAAAASDVASEDVLEVGQTESGTVEVVGVVADEIAVERAPAPRRGRAPSAVRLPMAWVLGAVFAMHGMCYFAATSWLPLLLSERSGLSTSAASVCVAVFMVLGIIGPLSLPALLRLPGVRLWMLMTTTTLGWLACMALLAVAPAWWVPAVLVGGLAQGACFTVIVTFGVHVARDEAQSRGIAAVLQTVGFAGGALGPVLIGAVRDSTGGWDAPLWVLVGVAVALVVIGGVASRLLVRHDATTTAAAAA